MSGGAASGRRCDFNPLPVRRPAENRLYQKPVSVIISTGSGAYECTSLRFADLAVSVADGVATVGAGATKYPCSFGDTLLICGSDGVLQPVGGMLWAQNMAALSLTTGAVTLNTGVGGDSTKMVPATVLVFSGLTVTNKGDGVFSVAGP
jgi:hypothetical protein